MRPLDKIILHCSATRPDWMKGVGLLAQRNEIRRWHVQQRGWSDIGYHYLIGRDGTVVEGRPLERIGAHVRGHNTGSIGICLIGGHGAASTDRFADHFTREQHDAAHRLTGCLQTTYGPLSLHGHQDFAAKACPGFDISTWLERGYDD